MFAWNKRGLVFDVARHGVGGWMDHAALTPTPHRLSAQVLRVYAGFRDAQGVSRIGYVDVRADAPTQIVGVSKQPVLDIGRDGCFDDNGMILGDVVAGPDGLYLFYVGFQRVAKAKFLAFTGLAVSHDGGERFQRRQETPLLDRAPGAARLPRCIRHATNRAAGGSGTQWATTGKRSAASRIRVTTSATPRPTTCIASPPTMLCACVHMATNTASGVRACTGSASAM